jgi:MFS transporter, PAT family, beta-lactamase induction signal transducer AmpG
MYFLRHDIALRDIGLMSLLFLPYTLKPAWAPLVDRLGSRQSWIVASQLGAAVFLLLFLRLDPRLLAGGPASSGYWLMWAVLFGFMMLSATQDIAIDAYAVDASRPEETGHVNGFRTAAYRVGLLFASWALLEISPRWGWTVVWLVSVALCLGLAVLAFLSPRVPRERAPTSTVAASGRLVAFRIASLLVAIALFVVAVQTDWQRLWTVFAALTAAAAVASFLSPDVLGWLLRKEMIPVTAFALLFKLGDSMLGRMVKPFWVSVGMTDVEVGRISSGLGMVLTIVGALLGGFFIARRGIFQALVWMGIAQLVSNFGYVAVAALHLPRGDASFLGLSFGPLQTSLYAASALESITQGLGTAAFMSFLMNQCDRAHAATQYAMLTAVFSLSRDVTGAFSGFGVEAFGYPAYFAFTAALAIPALLLLPWLRPRIRERSEPAVP